MDKIRIIGAAQKLKGSVEETVGKVIGNKKLEARGMISKGAGSARMTFGQLKDRIKASVKARTW